MSMDKTNRDRMRQKCSESSKLSQVTPITIREPVKADQLTFEDSDAFTRYFREHEDEFKDTNDAFLSTLRLNKMYLVPGYRISIVNRGKENEELILRKDYGQRSEQESELLMMIQKLEQRIAHIERFLSS